MIAIALDRLDARRHTFGLLLEHLIEAIAKQAPDLPLVLVRRRGRRDIVVPGVREIFIPQSLERNTIYTRVAPLWFRRQGIDLVHFPFLHTPATWIGGPRHRIVTIHGASRAAFGEDLVTPFSEAELDRTRQRLTAFDRVITVSESAKREVVDHYGVDPDRVVVIYNGVGEGFNPGALSEATLEKYGIRRPYILTVSTIKPKKNVTASVRAFARLRERHPDLPHQLVLVGYRAPNYSGVDDEIRRLGLDGSVVQTGWTASEEIPSFYAGADLLLFPSLHEGFGLPVVEAMASGCPVAASRVYSIPEVGGDAILTFDPLDVEAITQSADCLLFDRPLRERLVQSGFERAARFTWSESARQTVALYRDVLQGI